MINFFEKNLNEFVDLSEMANLRKNSTDLPMVIYVSEKLNVRGKHGPRIKVSTIYGDKISKKNLFTVTISDTPEVIGNTGDIKPKDLKKVIDFVVLNKKALLDYWELKIDIGDVIRKLKKK